MNREQKTTQIGDLLPTISPIEPVQALTDADAGASCADITPSPLPVTAAGDDEKKTRTPCVFQLFVMLPQDAPLWFLYGRIIQSAHKPHKDAKKKFTFRGDVYEKNNVGEMLKKLLRQLKKWRHQYYLAQIEDTRIPRDQPGRIVLLWQYGAVIESNLFYYENLLQNFDISWTLNQ